MRACPAFPLIIALSALLFGACSNSDAKDEGDAKIYSASAKTQNSVERLVRRAADDAEANVIVTKETAKDACGFVSTKGDVVRFLADFGEDKAYLARGSSADDSVVAAKC